MPIYYWRSKTGIGASGLGTEASPYTAKQLADAILAGTVAPGDTTMLMGEFGPVNLVDAADFPSHTALITDFLNITGPIVPAANAANSGIYGRNIVFGDQVGGSGLGTASKASGISFRARGGSKAQPNVDMRGNSRGSGPGAMTNAERQMAAIIIQGYDLVVSGFYIRNADHQWWAPGRVPANVALSSRVTESSLENMGLLVRGAWGSEVANCYAHGGVQGTYGIRLEHRSYSTDQTWQANKTLYYHDLEAESCGVACISFAPGKQINNASSCVMPNGAQLIYADILAHDGYFQNDIGTNEALRYGNLFEVTGTRCMFGNDVVGKRVIAYGDCQDAVVFLGVNLRGEAFDVYDTCTSYSVGQAVNFTAPSGANWVASGGNVSGIGIKLGLGDSYEGTPTGGLFGVGTPAGAYVTDQTRNTILYSRVRNTKSSGISTNGSSGMVLHANEVYNVATRAFSAINRPLTGWHLLTNNYLQGQYGIYIEDRNVVGAWNNIAVGSVNSVLLTGVGPDLYGARNLTSGAVSGTPRWTDTTAATPGYTVGAGPTPGGNCENAGDWAGVMELRRRAALLNMAYQPWRKGKLPRGPR